ncbi:MAG: hypothetical protein ABIH76_03680 [Candidatus Bathyarchaeota archaeon]
MDDAWTKTGGAYVSPGSSLSQDAYNAFLRGMLFRKLEIAEENWGRTLKLVKLHYKFYQVWSSALNSSEFREYHNLSEMYRSLKEEIEQILQQINDLLLSQKDLKGKCSFLD